MMAHCSQMRIFFFGGGGGKVDGTPTCRVETATSSAI